jgi:hypothetical protein
MVQLDNRSDKELEDALKTGELGPRKTAFAQEILRRREDAKGGRRFVFVRGVLAAITIVFAAFKRLWRS